MLLWVKIAIFITVTIITGIIIYVIVKRSKSSDTGGGGGSKGCVPKCDQYDCGDDGCGGSCGSCLNLDVCIKGTCCTPQCDRKNCGDDGCGGSCGNCSQTQKCVNGVCCPRQGTQPCKDRECGDDGCGGSCGECQAPQTCKNGTCCPSATACGTNECGVNTCGDSCGTCSGDKSVCHNGSCIVCSSSGDCGKNSVCYHPNTTASKCVCNPGWVINPKTNKCVFKPYLTLWTEPNYTGTKKVIDILTYGILNIGTGASKNGVISLSKPTMQYQSLELTVEDKSVPIAIRFSRSGHALANECYEVTASDLSTSNFKIPDLQSYIISNKPLNTALRFFDTATLFPYYQNQVFSLQLVETATNHTPCNPSTPPGKPSGTFMIVYPGKNFVGEFTVHTMNSTPNDRDYFAVTNSTSITKNSLIVVGSSGSKFRLHFYCPYCRLGNVGDCILTRPQTIGAKGQFPIPDIVAWLGTNPAGDADPCNGFTSEFNNLYADSECNYIMSLRPSNFFVPNPFPLQACPNGPPAGSITYVNDCAGCPD